MERWPGPGDDAAGRGGLATEAEPDLYGPASSPRGELRIPPDELASAIAQALRDLAPSGRRGDRRGALDSAAIGRGGWLVLAAGIGLGVLGALALGVVLGVGLSGYLAAPNRDLEIAAAALAVLGGVRAALRVRRAMRDGSWGLLVGALLDLGLAACAAAVAAGMRA